MADLPTLPHNKYRTPNGTIITLLSDDVLVRMDPLKEKTSGGLYIPDTAGDRGDAGILTTGTILAYGWKEYGGKTAKHPLMRIPYPELSVGLKCVFTRFYAEQHSNKQIQYRIEEGVIRLKPLDIIVVADPEDADKLLQ
jgi:co-chaperonin GroES (HSP10)